MVLCVVVVVVVGQSVPRVQVGDGGLGQGGLECRDGHDPVIPGSPLVEALEDSGPASIMDAAVGLFAEVEHAGLMLLRLLPIMRRRRRTPFQVLLLLPP